VCVCISSTRITDIRAGNPAEGGYLYTYMYVCVYIYIYIHVYMYKCIHTYMCTYTYMHICINVYIYICIYIYPPTHTHTHTFTRNRTFSMYAYIYYIHLSRSSAQVSQQMWGTCTYAHTNMYIYTQTITHICINAFISYVHASRLFAMFVHKKASGGEYLFIHAHT